MTVWDKKQAEAKQELVAIDEQIKELDLEVELTVKKLKLLSSETA